MTLGAAELKFDTDGNLHITNPTGAVFVNGRQVSGHEVSELRQQLAHSKQERDAERDRADRLEERNKALAEKQCEASDPSQPVTITRSEYQGILDRLQRLESEGTY